MDHQQKLHDRLQKGSKVDEYAQEFGFTTEYAELSEELDG